MRVKSWTQCQTGLGNRRMNRLGCISSNDDDYIFYVFQDEKEENQDQSNERHKQKVKKK